MYLHFSPDLLPTCEKKQYKIVTQFFGEGLKEKKNEVTDAKETRRYSDWLIHEYSIPSVTPLMKPTSELS
jgi:hypothetical protein